MRIATITWITHNNYGTLLQAYALQQFLKAHGFQNEIVSDQNITRVQKAAPTPPATVVEPCAEDRPSPLTRTMLRIKKYVLHPAMLIKSVRDYCQDKRFSLERERFEKEQWRFERFRNKQLDIASGFRREDMKALNQVYDVFLCGSDQIWSVLEQNFDGYYYLDFVTKKKVSYACSIGTDKIDHAHRERIVAWLSSYSAISVREQQTAKQLAEFTKRPVEWVSDPTLLYDEAFWVDFCKEVRIPNKKYLLCYFLSNNSWYFKYAAALAKHLKLKLLLIPANAQQLRKKGCSRSIPGPAEFVALIRHAEYVLTDSYHGSIFSMIFEKEFIYLKRFRDSAPNCQNIRIFSLFEKVGLMDRIVEEREFALDDVRPINYEKVRGTLKNFRESSRRFLLDALVDE